ncbi:MAG: hypothetical protein MZW92_28250 [Comamonadaceae bacterium]|nr:hypothetical protein [Comamonadaceae bacterium]
MLMARTHGTALGQAIAAEGAHRRSWRRSCAPRRPRPKRRAAPTRPPRRRAPTAPRRSSSPPPATTCASRCTRWACSPRRCASAAHDPEVASLVQQHQRVASTRSKACSASCWTSRASTPAASTCIPAPVRMRELFARLRLHFEPIGLREGAGAVASAASGTWRTPTRCCSSASCATWSATPSATPTTAACWSACRAAPAATAAAAGLGQRHRHRRAEPAAHLRRVLPGAEQRAPLRGAPPQGPGPGAGHRQAAGRT